MPNSYGNNMELEEFERLVEEGYEQLPQWVRDKISNVAVLIEDEPSEEVRKIEGLGENETLLGYYHGIPLTARGEHYGIGITMPDTITLYRLPILEAALESLSTLKDEENVRDRNSNMREAVKKEVADTIWHEFAHHFGMDEHEVRSREDVREKGNLL